MAFDSIAEAETALRGNGFARYEEDKKALEIIAKPGAPFHSRPHPNDAIYSSGRLWRCASQPISE